jgi:hypothetical protein
MFPAETIDTKGRKTVPSPARSRPSGRKGTAFKPRAHRLSRGAIDELTHHYKVGDSIDALAQHYGVHRATIIAQRDRPGAEFRRAGTHIRAL